MACNFERKYIYIEAKMMKRDYAKIITEENKTKKKTLSKKEKERQIERKEKKISTKNRI